MTKLQNLFDLVLIWLVFLAAISSPLWITRSIYPAISIDAWLNIVNCQGH